MAGGIRVQIPGGLESDGFIDRQVILKPITGYLEQLLLESIEAAGNLPAQVSYVLGDALAWIGRHEASATVASRLCVADRQYLMLRLAQLFEGDQIWLRPKCAACDKLFDVGLLRSQLPVQDAGPDFPYANLNLGNHEIKLRVPTGADQEKIAHLPPDKALIQLLKMCIEAINPPISVDELVASLVTVDIDQIDAVLEASSPAMCTTIMTRCPECSKEQTVTLDPYDIIHQRGDGFYQQVHAIAYHYHWSETEILSLPRNRRLRYLRYIDKAQGVHS